MTNNIAIELLSDRAQNPAFVYISGLASPISRRTMSSALGVIARKLGAANAFEFDWSRLRYADLAAIQTWLAGTHSVTATRRYVSACRGCLKASWRLGMISTDDYLRTIDLPPVHGNSKLGHRATDEELVQIYATCSSGSNRDIRDLSILRLMFGLGCRVGEVVPLQLADYNRNSGELQIFGKGRKHRDVFLCGSIRAAMEDWLSCRGLHTGALYEVIGWDDEIYHRPMASTHSVWEVFDKRCRRGGLDRRLSPHDARRTSISNMLNLADALTVGKLVGHSNPGITLHYDLRGDTEKLAACELVGAR